MAQFLKARFLSEAIKWKADPRHASDQFFAGLRYDPFIFQQARLTFPSYNQRFPVPANKEFVENFALDLANPTRNREILGIINPDSLTPEIEATNSQFETSAQLEQQAVAQTTGQPPAQPFSLTQRLPTIPKVPTIATSTTTIPEAEEPAETTTTTPVQAESTKETPQGSPPQTQPKASRPSFQTPRIPSAFTNAARSFGGNAGLFFQKNVGKHLTGDRAMNFFGKAGNAGINALSGITNFGGASGNVFSSLGGIGANGRGGGGILGRFNRFRKGNGSGGTGGLPISKSKGKIIWILFGSFFVGAIGIGLFGGITGQPPGAPPLPPNGTSINSCKFTRAGSSQPIKSSFLANWITSIAGTVGVPASVLASVAMHESPNVLQTYDDSNPAIIENKYCVNGSPVCVRGGQKEHDGTCSSDEIQAGLLTATAKGLMQIIDVYNTDMSEDDFCNIQKNIQRGAEILKGKAGSGSLNNENDIKKAVCGYFGPGGTTCPYPGGDYAADVWTDYQNCQTQPNATPGPILNSILVWNQKIVDSLNTGLWGYFNTLLSALSNNGYSTGTWAGTNEGTVYWCSYSIIDAYNLAGISGLSKGAHAAVINMRQFWQSPQASSTGYKYLDYPSNSALLNNVQSGYVIFMESVPGTHTGLEHVALIKTISLDTHGNGTITTNDSNSTQKSLQYPVVGWSVKNTPYTVTGFGGI